MTRRAFRLSTYVPPAPVAPDAAALGELADLRRRLEQLASLVGVDAAKIDSEPYELPRELERAAGTTTPLSLALRRIAGANGALHEAREAADGRRGASHRPRLMREARAAVGEAETAIRAAALPVAAE